MKKQTYNRISSSDRAKAIEMYYSEFKTYSEIAQAIGCTKGSVRLITNQYLGIGEQDIIGLKSKI